jgi:hypothetical protein
LDVPHKEKQKYRLALSKRFGFTPPIEHAIQLPGHDWFTHAYATISRVKGVDGGQMFE